MKKAFRSSKISTTLLALILSLLVLALAGCGGGAPQTSDTSTNDSGQTGGSDSSSTPADEPKKDFVPLNIGIITCADMCGWEFMAEEQGYLEEAGLTVNYIQADSSSTLIRSLLAGDVDIIAIAPPEGFIARATGGKVKVIGASLSGTAFSVLAKDSIKDLADLQTASVGTSQPGASPYMMVTGLLQKNGLDSSKINWVASGGNAARMAALLAGQIDASAVPTAFESQLESNPGFHVLARIGEDLPEYIRVALIASETAIEEKEAEIHEYFKAFSKGIRKAVEDKDAFVNLSLKATKGGEDQRATFEESWETHIKQRLISPDLSIDPEHLLFIQSLTLQAGTQQRELTIEEIFDDRFIQTVQKELGAWEWK